MFRWHPLNTLFISSFTPLNTDREKLIEAVFSCKFIVVIFTQRAQSFLLACLFGLAVSSFLFCLFWPSAARHLFPPVYSLSLITELGCRLNSTTHGSLN
ncbi:uncharacterized protein FA14DRAFT_91334 [Meira miltonrushii]|uniref:Uncharacterized protein n=1 Tax=Meira miltonrushii TaxID=1280837 RepID=A0A316V3M6_9BASI|nr:uncharacterized protein FA14DRAFT_91334 [Meira miltonrushii]PWN31598.1 hypothetical protein FA14DRAFT_91334 [Meira miltonrushii]